MKAPNPNRVKVLLICMGNICRSPTAHAVFRNLVQEHGLTELIEIDSAGTHAYHVGNPPDSRSMQTARKRGIDMSDLRARQVDLGDFYHYDYLIAMDDYNLSLLQEMAPSDMAHKLSLFLSFAPHLKEREIPTPTMVEQMGLSWCSTWYKRPVKDCSATLKPTTCIRINPLSESRT